MFAAMSVIWGIPYLLIKVAVGGVPVPVLVLCRVGIGAALLLPIAIRRRQLRQLLPHWRPLAVFACVHFRAPWRRRPEPDPRTAAARARRPRRRRARPAGASAAAA